MIQIYIISKGYRKLGVETVLAKVPTPTAATTTTTTASNGYGYDVKRIPEENSYPQPVPAPRRNNSIPNDTNQQGQQGPTSNTPGFHNDIASQVFFKLISN